MTWPRGGRGSATSSSGRKARQALSGGWSRRPGRERNRLSWSRATRRFIRLRKSVKRPALRPSSHVRDLVERTIGFALTFVLWAFAALVAVPWLYASAFNRALVAFAVSFGLAVNLAALIVCGVELLLLCRVGRGLANWAALWITAVLVLPFVVLDVLFGPLLRLLVRKKSS